jgi:hypothetical protein
MRVNPGWLALLVVAGLVGLVHYWVADPQQGPRVFADEIGYLANARYLAVGDMIDMTDTAFYAGGFSVAVVPLNWAYAEDPGGLYATLIALQAVLSALSVVLIAQLCRWVLAAPWTTAIVAAGAAGLYPALVINSGFAWSESMLVFSLLVALSACAWLVRAIDTEPERRRRVVVVSALAGLACGYVVTVHNRTILAMLAVVAIVGVALVRRRAAGAAAALAACFLAAGAAGQLLNQRLVDALWQGVGGIDASGTVSALVQPDGIWVASRAAIGQFWYQVVATGGLVAIALTALEMLVRSAPSSAAAPDTGSARSRPTIALTILGVFVGLAVLSAAFTAAGSFTEVGTRGDTFVYGRYVDIVTPLLVALAITWLSTSPARRLLRVAAAVVAVTAGTAYLVLRFAAQTELARPFNRATTMAIFGWLDPSTGQPMIFVATVWALVIAAALLVVSAIGFRRPTWLGLGVIAGIAVGLFSWQLSFTYSKLLDQLASEAADTRTMVAAVVAADASELGVDGSTTVVDSLAFAYWLPDIELIELTTAEGSCAGVISVSHTPRPLPGQEELARAGPLRLYRGELPCTV